MRDRRGQLDMAHPLAADLRQRDLDTALLADDAAILHPLVLAAQAFIVADRAEDTGAEQAVLLRLEGTIVDRFGLLDLAKRPGTDTFRRCDRDADLVKALGALVLPERIHQVVHVVISRRSVVLSGSDRGGRDQYSASWRSTFRPSERSSLTRTLKDSGMPDSKSSSPRTMAS